LTLTLSEIDQEIKILENESKALRKELYKIAWFMRGALNIEQCYMIDLSDIEIFSEIIKENLETTKESNLPFF
jgi:hypothetical protein